MLVYAFSLSLVGFLLFLFFETLEESFSVEDTEKALARTRQHRAMALRILRSK